jgi:hypothetical protein
MRGWTGREYVHICTRVSTTPSQVCDVIDQLFKSSLVLASKDLANATWPANAWLKHEVPAKSTVEVTVRP